ncbi:MULTISPECIES: AAA domain-containing protein [Bacillaceae]|uniref:AAA family ATPase n=1 Tax=Evansella alkalicola TaxID=745819 RepID=A0ABS6JSR6_9BACI|nr:MULTISPECIES: AAA domain-containing protein [Bacillaceae]MBU9721610.1 AAA family ATPase [Bacillus alkalicola]
MNSSNIDQDRALRLFTYLKEFSMLKTPLVRNVENYDDVLWFSEVPEEKECNTPLQDGDFHDVWVEIEKPIKPPVPSPSEKIVTWLESEDELNNENKEPKLVEQIPNPNYVEDDEDESPESRYINVNDYPEIINEFQKYMENEWMPWKEEVLRFKKVQSIYTNLFSIYQKQKNLGEQFELIVGVGLLNWKTPNGQIVHRHLLSVPATFDFDADTGVIRVVPSAQGINPDLEQDMLELEDRLDSTSLQPVIELIHLLQENFWDKTTQDSILRSYVQSLSAEGVYYEEETENKHNFAAEPIVLYSPALILRKRVEKGFQQACTKIIDNIESDPSSIPQGITRIFKTMDDLQPNGVAGMDTGVEAEDNIIYFPKEANEEQEKIISRLSSRNGVIVQGPPGTGKSHTIANLTSHLLATGKRVLITSETDRALKVLKAKLPEELQGLCVSLLGADSQSFKDLEHVIHMISNERDDWDPDVTKKEIDHLINKFHDLKEHEAALKHQLRSIRESETYTHYLIDGAYVGTAQNIAQQLRKDSDQYGWISDNVPLDYKFPLTNDEMMELVSLFDEIDLNIEEQLKRTFPDSKSLLTPEEFTGLTYREYSLREQLTKHQHISEEELEPFYRYSNTARNELFSTTEEVLSTIKLLESKSETWIQRALDDFSNKKAQEWKEFYQQVEALLNEVSELSKKHSLVEVTGLSDGSLNDVKSDTSLLRKHLESGKGLGFPLIRPKVVKDSWYIVKDVKIDGRKCDNLESLIRLEEVLTVDCAINLMNHLMNDQLNIELPKKTGRGLMIAAIKNELEIFNEIMKLGDLLKEIPLELSNNLSKDSLLSLRNKLELLAVKDEIKTIEESINNMLDNLNRVETDTHDVVERIRMSITNRNIEEYVTFFNQLLQLEHYATKSNRCSELKMLLKESLPALYDELSHSTNYVEWKNRIEYFNKALNWAKANTWLNNFINLDVEQLTKDLEKVAKDIKTTLTELGANKAWSSTLMKMTETQRQHLMAWSTSIRKAGKKTGKHAPKHLKDAQYHMSFCRDAIPAWVLPLYRVCDTFEMEPNLFDVAIIDEASQSGPEAVILKYLSKKLIVVGDDKQISPEYVGLNRDDVNYLRKEFLSDFEIADMLDGDTSFFDLANVLFGGRITLREHFRCMPEIIEFSNKISYTNTPLTPLRQYPPNRLEPIKTKQIANGYREGSGQKVLNRLEAEAVVEQIKRCINDPRYNGKTMGVISLQSTGQAQEVQRLLVNEIGTEEMERRNLICGDAYAFQGDERDIIFLSLVAAPGETGMRALTSEKDRRRFNVAASRAKDQLWLFHTPTVNDFRNKSCLRYQLIAYCQDPCKKTMESNREKCESDFERAVFDQISTRGFKVVPQHEVAGFRIDLIVEGTTGRIAVECDGDQWHGPERYEYDMNRQRILERCGWKFWRVRGSEYYRSPETALDSLWKTLDLYDIRPEGYEQEPRVEGNSDERSSSKKQQNSDKLASSIKTKTITLKKKSTHNKDKKKDKIFQETQDEPNKVEQMYLFSGDEEEQLTLFEEETSTPIITISEDESVKTDDMKVSQSPTLKSYLENEGFEVIDKRPKGGALWVIEAQELTPIIQQLKRQGIEFTYSKNGGRATRKKPAWFTSYKD